MVFRQLFDPQSSTYTYLLADPGSREALLIDPVFEQARRDAALIDELGLKLAFTLETHVHADHVTAASALRDRTGCRSALHRSSGADCADLLFDDGAVLQVGDIRIEVRTTPGHTSSCVSYVVGDRVLTGDALLIGGCGRTDFQGGSAERLYHSVHTRLFTLPPDTLVFPAHDYKGRTVSTIKEEMACNSRLGGACGKRPGTTRPPTNRSTSPSRSQSAAHTQLLLVRTSGNMPPGAFVNAPLPSFTYSRSRSAAAPSFASTPPLTTYRSRSPSLSKSTKQAPMSSLSASARHGPSIGWWSLRSSRTSVPA